MSYNVLIVDDEPIIRRGLASCLDWAGNGLRLIGEAANGEAALRLLENELVDILITDIKMPIMDGLELIRRIKVNCPAVKAILVSSYSDFEYAREAVKLGVVVDYLLKPTMEPEDLARVMLQCKAQLDKERNAIQLEMGLKRGHRRQQMHILGLKLHAMLDQAEQAPDWKTEWSPEWMQGPLAASVWRIEQSRSDHKHGRPSAGGRVLELEQACDLVHDWSAAAVAFVISSDELVMLSADHNNRAQHAVNDLHLRFQHERNTSFTVGISPSFHSIQSFPQAVGWAASALERSFFDGTGKCYVGKIARPESDDGEEKKQQERDAELWREQFSKAIAYGDKESCVTLANELIEAWLNNKETRSGIITQAKRLITIIWTNQGTMKSETMIQQLLKRLEEIESIRSLPELAGLIRKEISGLWEPGQLLLRTSEAGGVHVIQLALSYIQENYRREISLQEVADYVHMSRNYFSEQFKRRTGFNFIDFVIQLRIQYAKQLLDHTGLKVLEVGMESGFNSPKHFLKLFKRMTGFTPAEYRQKPHADIGREDAARE